MSTKNRPLKMIIFITFCGCILGSILQRFFLFITPQETIVRKFFVDTTYIVGLPKDFGIDLGLLNMGFHFRFEVGVLSLFGIFMSWYFLRYFR
tara:strand:+ start:405 stop:683 length:279 start_codon:yes stop_codon:yes gene_type:complete